MLRKTQKKPYNITKKVRLQSYLQSENSEKILKGVDNGYSGAYVNLAFCHTNGIHVKKNPQRAYDLYYSAASKVNFSDHFRYHFFRHLRK